MLGGGSNFILDGGLISNNTAKHGGGVYVDYGTFTMKNGRISGNTAKYSSGDSNTGIGGGVYVTGSGTFTMKSCRISGNTASSYTSGNGGGVYVDSGTFMMKSGVISGNKAKGNSGGGVALYRDGSGPVTFTMEGGTISGNTAKTGGGIRFASNDANIITLNGGSISGNTASDRGDEMYAGRMFNISGSAAVGPNITYLDDSSIYINVTGPLTNNGGVKNIFASSTPIRLYSTATADSLRWFSVDPSVGAKLVFNSSGPCIDLVSPYNVTVTGGSGGGKYFEDDPVTITAIPPSGKVFIEWTNSSGIGFTDKNAAVTTFTMPADDVSVTATYKDAPAPPVPGSSSDGNMNNAFRVLFDTQGGSVLSPATGLSYGNRVENPADPTRDGYTFGGWYKDSACTQAWSFSESIPGDMTLYAKWTASSGGQPATATATVPTTAPQTAEATPVAIQSQTAAATTAAPVTTTAAGVSPTQAPSPVFGALLGVLAAGVLLRRRE